MNRSRSRLDQSRLDWSRLDRLGITVHGGTIENAITNVTIRAEEMDPHSEVKNLSLKNPEIMQFYLKNSILTSSMGFNFEHIFFFAKLGPYLH